MKYQRVGQDSAEQNYSAAVTVTDKTTGIYFRLYDGSTLLDSEYVPVLQDAEDLQIGGRNLLMKTNQGTTNWEGHSADGGYSLMKWEEGIELNVTSVPGGWGMYLNYVLTDTLPLLEPNTNYMLSFDGWSDKDQTKEVSIRGESSNDPLTQRNASYRLQADKIVHFELPLKTNDLSTLEKQVLYFHNMGKQVTKFRFKNLKLEKGTVATAWTPAPEDIEADLTEFKTETEAKFEATNEAITASVTETKTYTDTAISDIQIGARNLVTGTGTPFVTTGRNIQNQSTVTDWVILAEAGGGKNLICTCTVILEGCTFSDNSHIVIQTRDYNNWDYLSLTNTLYMTQNGTYQLSRKFISRGDGETKIQVRVDYISGGTITVKDLRVYEGNKDVGWTPAPEDFTAKTEEITAELEVQAGQISGIVKDVTTINGNISTIQSSITQMSDKIDLAVKKDDLTVAGITLSKDGIVATANKFLIKQTDGTNVALFEGKYLNVSLINVESLFAQEVETGNIIVTNGAKIGDFTIDSGGLLYNVGNNYFTLLKDGISFTSQYQTVGLGRTMSETSGLADMVGGYYSIKLPSNGSYSSGYGAVTIRTSGGYAPFDTRQVGLAIVTQNGNYDYALDLKGRIRINGKKAFTGTWQINDQWGTLHHLYIQDGIVYNFD